MLLTLLVLLMLLLRSFFARFGCWDAREQGARPLLVAAAKEREEEEGGAGGGAGGRGKAVRLRLPNNASSRNVLLGRVATDPHARSPRGEQPCPALPWAGQRATPLSAGP